jgi:hypothetical protein
MLAVIGKFWLGLDDRRRFERRSCFFSAVSKAAGKEGVVGGE